MNFYYSSHCNDNSLHLEDANRICVERKTYLKSFHTKYFFVIHYYGI